MALHEQDREDLLREGRQMGLRGETTLRAETVTLGFRRSNQMSLYCGADPVFQFNADGELRRVFLDGQRYAAESGRLVHLTRDRRGGRVSFVANRVDDTSHQAIAMRLESWLTALNAAVENAETPWRVEGGTAEQFRNRSQAWFQGRERPIRIARVPNA